MKSFASLILAFLTGSGALIAQNLVPNPSFETYSPCPTSSSQVTYATGWMAAMNSPEYLNSCSASIYADVPTNYFGFQNAATGQAYMGGLFYGSFAGSYLANLREHLYIALSSPLVVGQTYYLAFKVSLADNSEYAINRAGMQFCSSYNASFGMNNTAHLFSSSVISDKVNWTQVTGSMVASSAYNAVMIGNFFDDANTTVTFVGSGTDIGYNAYYLIDDIYVSTTPLILPVEWVTVDVETEGRLATLHWECEAEGIERYSIETSLDGQAFTETQSVKAVDGQREYSQIDTMRGHLPVAFYRIRAIEQDGSTHLSPVVEAQLYESGIHFLRAYPNVLGQEEQLNVEYSAKANEAVTLNFYSLTGNLVRTELLPAVSAGQQHLTLPMDNMAPGSYILKAGHLTQRVVVTR